MGLIKDLLKREDYGLKCPYTMTPKGVTVHNTANDASARNEISFMKRNNTSTSFHVAIDDIEAIQAIPFDRNAFHAGDGSTGDGNRNYIAVEICYSLSGGTRFTNAEIRASREIALILKEYSWTIANVKKHQDFSGKYCPHRTLDLGWQRFLNMIKLELDKLNEVYDMDKLVVYLGDIDLHSAIIVARKHRCPVMRLEDYNLKKYKVKELIQIGGKPGSNVYTTFKDASTLV